MGKKRVLGPPRQRPAPANQDAPAIETAVQQAKLARPPEAWFHSALIMFTARLRSAQELLQTLQRFDIPDRVVDNVAQAELLFSDSRRQLLELARAYYPNFQPPAAAGKLDP